MTEQIEDDFWAQERARDTAARGQHADPAACGTCKTSVAAGSHVKHDECAQRATLLPAPDAPGWELITGMSEEEVWALPARFHTPAFIESSTPKVWVCAVCWGDGWSTQWPCKAATEQGLRVFTADDYAETRAKKQAAELAEHRAEATTPLLVDRFDVPMEHAPEEEPGLTIGAIAENGRPVALVFDEESRAKVASWLAPATDSPDLHSIVFNALTSTHGPLLPLPAPTLRLLAAAVTEAVSRQQSDAPEELRTAYVTALNTAHETQPCSCGSQIWSSCFHPERPGRTHSERRADAVLAVRDVEMDQLRARVAELENVRKKYVGAEPTIAEEMAYLGACLRAVGALSLPENLKVDTITADYRIGYIHALADMRTALEAPERTSYPPAFPWAQLMDDEDLAEFLAELEHAIAEPGATPNEALTAVERLCGTWRLIAEAQHAHNTAPGPNADGGEGR